MKRYVLSLPIADTLEFGKLNPHRGDIKMISCRWISWSFADWNTFSSSAAPQLAENIGRQREQGAEVGTCILKWADNEGGGPREKSVQICMGIYKSNNLINEKLHELQIELKIETIGFIAVFKFNFLQVQFYLHKGTWQQFNVETKS